MKIPQEYTLKFLSLIAVCKKNPSKIQDRTRRKNLVVFFEENLHESTIEGHIQLKSGVQN